MECGAVRSNRGIYFTELVDNTYKKKAFQLVVDSETQREYYINSRGARLHVVQHGVDAKMYSVPRAILVAIHGYGHHAE